MEKERKVTLTAIHDDTYQMIRVEAAKRGSTAGRFLNRILETRAALRAALAVLDEQDRKRNGVKGK